MNFLRTLRTKGVRWRLREERFWVPGREAGGRCGREREEWEVNGWETKSEWMGGWEEGDEDGDDGERCGSGGKEENVEVEEEGRGEKVENDVEDEGKESEVEDEGK